MKKRFSAKELFLDFLYIAVSGLLYAISFEIFIFPNEFAPAGIPGLMTMIQQKWNFPVSLMNVLINVPLGIATFFIVDKAYALKSGLCSLLLSGWMTVLEQFDLSAFIYKTPSSPVLAPIIGGMLCGLSVALVLKRGACTGGTDLIAELVHHYKPEQKMIWVLFGLNASVAVLSYFVYGYKIEPVLLCLIFCFSLSKTSDVLLKGLKEAIKFEIITDQPEELAQVLLEELGHGVTEIPAKGSFTKQSKTLLICVVNKNQIVAFQKILERFPGTFAYLHTVKETIGSFRTGKK
ncbi:MAG: YitT family protein [Oscillospiraceae bacterium]|nr:YitT family protein [Oscillospiraceae bacterium]